MAFGETFLLLKWTPLFDSNALLDKEKIEKIAYIVGGDQKNFPIHFTTCHSIIEGFLLQYSDLQIEESILMKKPKWEGQERIKVKELLEQVSKKEKIVFQLESKRHHYFVERDEILYIIESANRNLDKELKQTREELGHLNTSKDLFCFFSKEVTLQTGDLFGTDEQIEYDLFLSHKRSSGVHLGIQWVSLKIYFFIQMAD